MPEDIDETRIRTDLSSLTAVPADTIRAHADDHPEAYVRNDYVPIQLEQAVERMLGEWNRILESRPSNHVYEPFADSLEVSSRGYAYDEGTIAIRSGNDEFVLHRWYDTD